MLNNKLQQVYNLVKEGDLNSVFKGIKKRLKSNNKAFGLKRDIYKEFKDPEALIDLSIRDFHSSDNTFFIDDITNSGLIEKQIPNCYVAITNEGEPCYRQWLIGSKENKRIKEFWGDFFPELKKDEALLESAFTTPSYRGKRIMPAAMSRIAKKGSELGVRWVITFVDVQNIPSLKGCMRSGFHPYILRKEEWFLFNKKVTFENISDELMDQYIISIS
jgi:hypothetical protein